MRRFDFRYTDDFYEISQDKDFLFNIDNLPLNVDRTHEYGPPLMLAAKEGLLNFVKLFIKGKATTDKRGYLGITALMSAATNQHTEVVKELIAAGAQIELTESEYGGRTALDMSLSEKKVSLSTIRVLLEGGAHIRSTELLSRFEPSTKLLFQLLKVNVPQELREDKYFCLSILCEQAEEKHAKTLSDKATIPPKPDPDQEFLEQAENLLYKLPRPTGESYTIKAEAVMKEMEETIPLLIKPMIKIIGGYDNAFRHRWFNNLIKVKPQESLLEAAKNGHTESVKEILESKTININIEYETNYINLIDEFSMTPLMWAAWNGHTNIVKELVKHKANVELQGGSGTALDIANEYGRTDIVEFLTSYKPNPHSMKSGRLRRFDFRYTDDFYEISQDKDFLFNIDNLPLNVDRTHEYGPPLMLAAKEGLLNFVKLFIKGKATTDKRGYLGITALMSAATNQHTEVVKELIAAGAQIELTEYGGQTALDMSLSEKKVSLSTIRVLLEGGAHIRSTELLSRFEPSTKLLFQLLKVNVPQELREDKYFCLSILCEQAEEKHAKTLSDKATIPPKPDPDQEFLEQAENLLYKLPRPTGESYTIKAEAVMKEMEETIPLLIKPMIKIIGGYDNAFRHRWFNNLIKVKPQESLLEAAKNGHTESVKEILESKTININIEHETNYINLIDEFSMTPLIWAAWNGHTNIVKELVKHKANVELQGGSGTALDIANEYGRTDIVEFLTSYKPNPHSMKSGR